MASDADLKLLRTALNVGGRPMCSLEEWSSALSSAISALEAREAQPKVEGRMDDATLDAETEHVKAGLRASPKGGVTAFQCLTIELRRARASEAALKKEARHWEAKWLQEKMEHKKLKKIADANVAIASSLRASLSAAQKRIEELEKLIRMDYRGEHPYHAQGPCLCLQCEIARERRRLGFPG